MVDNTMLMDLMDAYLTECEIRKLAPKTIEGYKKLLRAMLLWLSDNEQVERLSDLTPMHYKRYLLHKEKDGASPQYINDILRVMRTFSRFLYDEGYTPKLLISILKFYEFEAKTARDRHIVCWSPAVNIISIVISMLRKGWAYKIRRKRCC